MTELYDSEGNAVEAFSKEEMDEKIDEATEGIKEEVEEINKEQEEKITDLSDQLEKEQDKEKNFAALRAKQGEGEEQPSEEEEETQETIEDLKQQIENAENAGVSKVVEMQRSSIIKELAEGDEDLKEKIEANYELITKPEGTTEEIQTRARDAYIMSMEIGHEDLADDESITPPSGPGTAVGGGGAAGVGDELKDMGKKFGVNDKDWDQFNK